MTKRISFCLIVKNEEKNLGRCLESIKPVADEIVVIDTGSTDRTKEIAISYGAKVFEKEWTDDYSEARNEYFKHATGDFIFSIDADEWVNKSNYPEFQKIKERDLALYSTMIFSIKTSGDILYSSNFRLFPNDTRLRWEFIVHENLRDDGKVFQTLPSKLFLLHSGYMVEEIQRKKTAERNLRLLKRQIEKTPDSLYFLYHLGNELYHSGDSKASQKSFSRVLEALLRTPDSIYCQYLPSVYEGLALCAIDLNESESIEALSKVDTISPNFYIQLSRHFKLQGQFGKAHELADKAINVISQVKNLITYDDGDVSFKPYVNKADIYLKEGNPVKAYDYFRLAYLERENNVVIRILAGLASQVGRFKDAEKFVGLAIKNDDTTENRLLRADIDINSGKIEKGFETYFKEGTPEQIYDLAKVLTNSQRPELSEKLLGHIENRFEYHSFIKKETLSDCVTIVIPTLWKADKGEFGRTLRNLSACPAVSKIVILDNAKSGSPFPIPEKVDVLSGLNLYVNPAWNYGVETSKTKYYLLLNDDCIADASVVESCVQILENYPDYDVVVSKTSEEHYDDYISSLEKTDRVEFVNVPISKIFGGWFILGRVEGWKSIPDNSALRIFYGDDYIYDQTIFRRKKKICKLVSGHVSHFASTTCNSEGIYGTPELLEARKVYSNIRLIEFKSELRY